MIQLKLQGPLSPRSLIAEWPTNNPQHAWPEIGSLGVGFARAVWGRTYARSSSMGRWNLGRTGVNQLQRLDVASIEELRTQYTIHPAKPPLHLELRSEAAIAPFKPLPPPPKGYPHRV